MRAYRLNAFGLDHLQRTELPEPQPGPGRVLVKMQAAALNYRDLLVARGELYRGVELPLVPVSDGAGTVVAVGEGVQRFRPGDRVTTLYKARWLAGAIRPEWVGAEPGGPDDGVMRDLACFDAYALARAPRHLDHRQAATLPIAALTAWQALDLAQLTSGQSVLILGTGGVSLFALQFARLRGARTIVLSSSDKKLERAQGLGADIVINYRRHPQWSPLVREATGGLGVDAVIETVGAATLAQSIDAAAMHGFIGVVGFMGGDEASIRLTQAVLKRLRIQGLSVAPLEQHERMVAAIEQGRLEPVVDRVFGFDQLREAMEFMASGQHFGKVVIDFER
ncbi:MAG: alcohol dehydrogenase [Lysobacterales bacterium 14-68-21]|jgi:NADPH:quinone reductase-like Zn-dependent oxidoreductase|nr:MAG: alcohol dehydrogenase [Xanthomonadales bacterium 15-68-25]OZB68074.1 MAG: alcohol dehydrogenase [Xanthomonadales bacterium 14-68-21]